MQEVIHEIVEITDLKDMLKKSGDLYGDRPAYRFKTEEPEKFDIITHKEYREMVDSLGTAFIKLGLKGKRIAVIGENRYEWGLSYLAISCGTGIVVPLDKALPENEIKSLIERSGVEAICYSKKYDEIMKKFKDDGVGKLKHLISMDLEKHEDGIYSLKELVERGKILIAEGDRSFLDAEINAEEMGMLLFTSGTTQAAKAVMLSHKIICTNLMDIARVLEIHERDTMLSFLPIHHAFECTAGFLYPLYKGAEVVFCEGIKHIADNLKEYKVTAMISVPILFENMYRRLLKTVEKKGKLEAVKKGVKISNVLTKLHIDVRKKLFKEIHEALGGKVRLFVSGAAGLDPEVERGYNELGIRLIQGYGLTETAPIIAAGTDRRYRQGSVGPIFPSLEARIGNPDEDGIGEIQVKGPSVMLGYYENEEANKEVFEDGWFKTGDLGYIDKDGFLFISGREKSVIVLKNGKNVFPEELENLVNRIEGVSESMVYGKPEEDGDTKVCIKVVYDEEVMNEMYKTKDEAVIYDIITKKVKEVNKKMPAYKYIREITITTEPLIKTTTAKIKRHEELAKIL